MHFINKTNNTIYIQDIDKSIPHLENNQEQEIALDDVKKSIGFVKLVLLGMIEITSHDNSIFERNLVRKQGSLKSTEPEKIPVQEKEEITPEADRIEVKIRGHIYEAGGYAKVNRNLIKGLYNEGVKVNFEAVNNKNDLTEEEIRSLNKCTSQLSKKAIIIDSIIPTLSNMGMGKYKIIYTTIEACTIPKQFIEILNNYNEVWVASDFCKEVLINHGFKRPIFVLPNSIDTKLYQEAYEPYSFTPSLKPFVFGSVFGWGYRKGWDALLKAYLGEFSGNDPVSLLIISRNNMGGNKNDIIKEEIQRFISIYGGKNPAHIARCSKVIPENEMPSIYKAFNAFVLFSRGEGFGIPYLESSLCGIPVIATNYSGHSMFLKEDNSYLINIDQIKIIPKGTTGVHFWDNEKFPALTDDIFIRNAGKIMRYVFENYEEAKEKNKKLQYVARQNYSIEAVARKAKSRLSEIWRKL